MRRWNRRPRFPVAGHIGKTGKLQLIHKQFVNPGETMKELRGQLKLRTNPAKCLDVPGYVELSAWYIPLRIIDEGFPDFLVSNGSLSVPTYASDAASNNFLGANGAYAWEEEAMKLVGKEYLSTETFDNSADLNMRNPDTDWTLQLPQTDADVDITTATTTNELDEKYAERDYEVRREGWEGSYRRYLQGLGVQLSEDALSVPERLYRYRRFIEPATIVDPSTGEYKSVWTADIDRTMRKPIYFSEHGVVIVLFGLLPRILLDNPDADQYVTEPEEFPTPQMLNAHVMKDAALFWGATAERASINERFWRGQHQLRGVEDHDYRKELIFMKPADRDELLYPASSASGFLDTDLTTWTNLNARTFGTAAAPMRYQGLFTTQIATSIPRVGSDARPRVLLGKV